MPPPILLSGHERVQFLPAGQAIIISTAHHLDRAHCAPSLDCQVERQSFSPCREHPYCESVARAHGVTVDIDYHLGYPVTLNHSEATELARQVIRRTFGEAGYTELPESSMAAEDFAYYLQRYPGVYVKLGTGENCPALHNSKFDFPDEALKVGIEYLVEFALAALR